jgi:hypothetical protein
MSDPFLDIAPATETVAGVPVTGVTLHMVAGLMTKSPVLGAMIAGGTVDAAQLAGAAPDAVTALVLAAIGRPGDAAAEEKFKGLPLGLQAQFLDAAIRATFPEGVGPFKETLLRLASALKVSAADAGDDAAAGSPAPSRG